MFLDPLVTVSVLEPEASLLESIGEGLRTWPCLGLELPLVESLPDPCPCAVFHANIYTMLGRKLGSRNMHPREASTKQEDGGWEQLGSYCSYGSPGDPVGFKLLPATRPWRLSHPQIPLQSQGSQPYRTPIKNTQTVKMSRNIKDRGLSDSQPNLIIPSPQTDAIRPVAPNFIFTTSKDIFCKNVFPSIHPSKFYLLVLVNVMGEFVFVCTKIFQYKKN